MPKNNAKQTVPPAPLLMRVYSESETKNFNSKTGHRIYDDFKHRNTNSSLALNKQDNDDMMANQTRGTRHFSINEPTERFKKVKSLLDPRGLGNTYTNAGTIGFLDEPNKPLNGEDDENSLDLYFKENLDSIIYDNECLIPLEALPKNKPGKAVKRKRRFSNDSSTTAVKSKKDAASMMYDEYIPDLDFINNFKRMQDYYETTPTFDEEEADQENPDIAKRSESNVLNELMEHSHVVPMKIQTDNDTEVKNYNAEQIASSNSFIDVTKLPLEFEDLPYSQRKKILVGMCPEKEYQEILLEIKKPHNQLRRMQAKGVPQSPSESNVIPRSHRSSTSISTANSILSRFDGSSSLQSGLTSSKGLQVMGYKLNKIIGKGAWGVIRECTNTSDSSDVKAMKIVKYKDNLSVKLSVINEVAIWKDLRHKNILSLVDYMQGENGMFCLMNQIHGGTLYDYVAKKWYHNELEYPLKKRLGLISNYSKQIVDALNYLHNDAHIVHGDLKLENCLMTTGGRVLLCDFGMARKLKPSDIIKHPSSRNHIFKKHNSSANVKNTAFNYGNKNKNSVLNLKKMINDKSLTHDDTPLCISCFDVNIGPAYQSTVLKLQEEKKNKTVLTLNQIGSLPYAAPELLDIKNKITPMTDIWALGVLMYTMCVYELPFQHEFEPRLKMMIESGKYDYKKLSALVLKTHPSLFFVIEGCLKKNINERWPLEKIRRNMSIE